MSKQDYIPNDDGSLAGRLEQFAANVGGYTTTLGLSSTDVTAQAADAAYLRYVLTQQQRFQQAGQQWTAWKNLLRDGGTGTIAGAPVFLTPPGTAVAAVLPGIVARFRALVRRVKAATNYSVAIGEALGIEGPQSTAPDLATLQPVLAPTVAGDRVHLDWTKSEADSLELLVDRGDGKGFVFLAVDTVPDYVDTAPIPAAPAVWKYKAIYRVGDERVGQWSPVVSVPLGG